MLPQDLSILDGPEQPEACHLRGNSKCEIVGFKKLKRSFAGRKCGRQMACWH